MTTNLSNPNETTEAEITRRVFEGAGVSDFRGLTDAFSDAEIAEIADNPGAGHWRERAIEYLSGVETEVC